MGKLLRKELRLTASILSYLFIVFALLAFCPGYPILVGCFFLCWGLFQSFQAAREANDILYSALLPVSKSAVVKSKYIFCVFIELCYFLVTATVTLLRMTVLSQAAPYRANALMGANLVYLGYVLLMFGLFNALFVGGFFKTAYKFGKPFVTFAIVAFLMVALAEALWHFPGLGALNAFGFDHLGLQLACLGLGALLGVLLTLLSQRTAVRNFEKLDL